MRTLLTLFITLIPTLFCLAQGNMAFRLIDTTEGLPDNEVKTMIYVPDGRLAVRTTSRLSLFDGCQFSSFSPTGLDAYSMHYVSGLPTAYVDNQNHIWLKETGRLTVFSLHEERFLPNITEILNALGMHEHIDNFFIDAEKHLWFITHKGVLYQHDGKQLRRINISTRGLRDIASHQGITWLVYANGILQALNAKTLRTVSHQQLWQGTVSDRDFVRFSQSKNNLWVMWNNGVATYMGGKWQKRHEDKQNTLVTMAVDDKNRAFVSIRHHGLLSILPDGTKQLHASLPIWKGTALSDDIESIVCQQGNILLGLYANGLCLYNDNMQGFPFHTFTRDLGNYQLAEHSGGKALLAYASGLMQYDPISGSVSPFHPDSQAHDVINSFTASDGKTYVGTFRRGMFIIDGHACKHITQGEIPAQDINYNIVRGFAEDRQHRIWVSFHGGLGYYDAKHQRIVPVKSGTLTNHKVINQITIDPSNRLWAATSNGLVRYDIDKQKTYTTDSLVRGQKSRLHLSESCKTVCVDSRGMVWIGTLNGLYVYNPKTKRTQRFGKEDGMPNEMIQGIVEDDFHHIWVTTANGLCRLQPSGKDDYTLTVFDGQNKLGDSKFLPLAIAKAANGKILAGCVNGIYTINPAEVKAMRYKGHPIFMSLSVNGTDIIPGLEYDGTMILDSAINVARRITLNHDQNFITLRFSGLNFDMPQHTSYRYRLKGLNDSWVEISPQDGMGIATYTNLPPGKYIFEAYSAGFDKQWSAKPITIEIIVKAPLWATWWAKTFYLLLAITLIALAIRWKISQKRKQFEAEKYKELEEMKYRFFTNISHEFRTLLTLIITPIGSILRKTSDEDTRQQLNSVSKNAGDLLQLVNQLLDFRKMEMNGEQLHLQSGNINEFVDYTVQKFSPLSEQKGIALKMEDKTGGIFMYFDRDKVGKILNNLLSNAFKFTAQGGIVSVCLEKTIKNSRRYVRIVVSDTGCGISKEDQMRVFDRFFRSEQQNTTNVGSGIGLNMVAEYVKIHQGEIFLESEEGKGSRFIVELPTDLTIKSSEPSDSSDSSESSESSEPLRVSPILSDSSEKSPKSILIVEDNPEFRNFLVKELSAIYKNVLSAKDGIEGALQAEEQNPDIIVSDVMMPRMSGTDMCRRIKENLQTSHIPVILLTAWSNDEARTEGYKAGADAYIAKPFDLEMLLARITNLLEKQERRIADFSHNVSLDPKQVTDSSPDEGLLKEVIACIEKNIDNSEYGVDQLAKDVVMSRMGLYRKMKALTGQTPADFIRTVRLKSAASLLQTGKYNVSEVCYLTGFASPQNFSKHFKEMFGVLPSQYMK